MKGLLIFIVFLSLFSLNVYAEGEILINGNIQASPLFYEPQYNIVGIDLGTSWRLGFHQKSYTIGILASFDYTFYDNSFDSPFSYNTDTILNVQGNWLHTRVLLDQAYKITKGFEVEWSAGFVWFNNSINYDETGIQTTDFYGLSFDFNLQFTLAKNFLICEIMNRVDLLYSFDQDFQLSNMAPHYYGGLRFYINFGVKWFQMYLEAKGQYWNYTDSLNKINTGIASGGLGFCLNIPPIKIKKNTQREENEKAGEEEKEKLDPNVEKLKIITKGDTVKFHNLLFVKHTTELLPISYEILDQIIIVLKQREGVSFIISAYSEYLENPVEEFELYTGRARKIKNYLIQGGIDKNRLKVSSIGQIVTENNQKQGSTVIFKVAHEEGLENLAI